MKRLLCTALAVFFVCALLLPTHSRALAQRDGDTPGTCGVERERVKVLEDPSAASIDFRPRASSVAQIRALPVPSGYDRNSQTRYASEHAVLHVRAVLVGWKYENDKDFHIVIAQPGHTDQTMIVEPPDPSCSTSPKAAAFAAVRAAFVRCFGAPARWKKLPPMLVDLTGLLYFDPLHGQTGVAPNGAELHPLLSVKTVSGACPGGVK